MFKKLAMIAVVLMLGASSVACTRIQPGYVGITVKAGGSDRGVQDFPATTGWVFYNPFSTSVLEYPTFVQNAVWSKDPNQGSPSNEEVTFTNKDQMLIAVDVNLSYHLDASKVPAFYVKFRNDDLNLFTHGFLRTTAQEVFNEHAGRYPIESIMGDNGAFLKEVRESLQERVRDLGVGIDQFGIVGAPRPPQAVIDAITAKVHAIQLAQQKQNELVQVQAEAAKEVAEAEGHAKAVILAANAQAQANEKLASSMTPTLLQLKLLEHWNGVLPVVNGGSTNPFVSLDTIIKK